MKKYLMDYVRENSKILTIFSMCILIGVVCGIIMFQFSSYSAKEELRNSVIDTLNISKQDNYEGLSIIKNGITTNLILIVLIYFSTITIISPIMISLLNITKGISIGIYIPILFSIFGISKGILTLIFLIIIPNIFYIPAFLFLSTSALNLHFVIINKEENKVKIIIKQAVYIIVAFSFIFLSVLFEQILANNVIGIYKGL